MVTGSSTDKLIEKDGGIDPELTYSNLRSRAIQMVQEFSGQTWTDFNLHDPGVTILEYLCFALSDLAYRTNFSIEDLLVNQEGIIDKQKNNFFSRREILSTSPVTINDYRRLILDREPDLFNIWLEPFSAIRKTYHTKGIYRVFLQLQNDKYVNDAAKGSGNEVFSRNIIDRVMTLLNENRNIGEYFSEPVVIEPLETDIRAEIIIDRHQAPELTLADIYTALENLLNPTLKFYAEKELTEMGFAQEKIHEGPYLEHGFLPDEELEKKRTAEIDPTDLVKEIAAIPGVLVVRKLSVWINGKEEKNNIKVPENEYPDIKVNWDNPGIKLLIENDEVTVKAGLFRSQMKKKNDFRRTILVRNTGKTFENNLVKGDYRNLENYFSIQHLFPPIYKLYEDWLNPDHNGNRNQNSEDGRVKQLKAYLMIFEQFLANYLSQLAHINDIFSIPSGEIRYRTYFAQPLYNVPGAQKILAAFSGPDNGNVKKSWEEFKKDPDNGYCRFLNRELETDAEYYNRKNRILDHMLARFNYVPEKYPVELFCRLYGWKKSNSELDALLEWKSGLLKNVGLFSKNRAQGYNAAGSGKSSSRGGFEDYMNHLLFINNPDQRSLCEGFNITVDGEHAKIELKTNKKNIFKEKPANSLKQPGNTENNKGLNFSKVSRVFFRDGIDQRNYEVVQEQQPLNVQEAFELKFRSSGKIGNPASGHWATVGRFPDRKSAEMAKQEFISQLRELNILSEGFHLVDHILMRPPDRSASYGFYLEHHAGNPIASQYEWMSFQKREETFIRISRLSAELKKDLANNPLQQEYPYLNMAKQLEGLCCIATDHDNASMNFVKPYIYYYNANTREKKIKANEQLRFFFETFDSAEHKGKGLYPSVKPRLRFPDHTEVEEDFFNSRITVVLPSWPARFQNQNFREFTEKAFIESSPVWLRYKFEWLDIIQMKKFEGIYGRWMDSMKNISDESIRYAGLLALFLKG